MADHFGVAPMTVQNALRVLRGDGVITTRQGTGSYVREVPAPARDLAADVYELHDQVARLERLCDEHVPG